eukprot:TRINITY_DN12596_c0_g1_i2.p1 TRINITY_DN12596_c0_g1~~TRINITY_DN12596_c0_g1_i2.p1  ORF type:complete len:140 (-),score=22.45 TRINITY_DN12596_c0_g1_i2:11-430(-)
MDSIINFLIHLLDIAAMVPQFHLLHVSGSMYRFNGTDGRLERLMETALLIMESLDGFDHKFSYSLVGHSGDGPSIPLVAYGDAPKTRKERLKVLQRMYAHSQYCSSGDYTLEAVKQGIAEIGRAVQQECRDRSRMPSSA